MLVDFNKKNKYFHIKRPKRHLLLDFCSVYLLLKIALSQVFDKLTDSISPILMASSTSAGTMSPPFSEKKKYLAQCYFDF